MIELKQINSGIKIRFFCWLVITAIFLVCFFRTLSTGLPINSNILDLLPQHNHVIAKSADLFSKSMGKQLIFLVGNSSKSKAQKAANQFFEKIKQSPLLQKINYLVTEDEQNAWGNLYFTHRLSLLTPQQKELLQEDKITQIQQSALFSLYSPFGIKNSDFFENDPFFLFQNYIMSLPKPTSNLSLYNQRMMVHHNQQWYVMLTAQLKNDSFSISNQNEAIQLIQMSKKSVLKNFPHTNILMNGMLFYAKAGADGAQRDISTIGVGSLIGIILLILLTFRSLSPLIFTLMSSTIGFIAAFVVYRSRMKKRYLIFVNFLVLCLLIFFKTDFSCINFN